MKTKPRASRTPATASPPHPLVSWLHGCSPNPDNRTMAAAMFVLTHWQMAGLLFGSELPWFLLVNAGDAKTDPLDSAHDDIATGMGCKETRQEGHGVLSGATPESAKTRMRHVIAERGSLGAPTAGNQKRIEELERHFIAGKAQVFGHGRTGHYAQMWDDELGWITDESNHIILRLDRPDDHAAFRKDVLGDSRWLRDPVGVGASLTMERKYLMVSGSLDSSQWTGDLAARLLHVPRPFFFLPHLAHEALVCENRLVLFCTSLKFPGSRVDPLGLPMQLPEDNWSRHYAKLMRRLLRQLPGEYEFMVNCVVRMLQPLCMRIVQHYAPKGCDDQQQVDLFADLHHMAWRGIVIGLAALKWHGLGIDAGCGLRWTFEQVKHIHQHGPVSRRDLQMRFQQFNAASRDQLLERLAHEGVLELEDRKVAIVPLGDFVRRLFAREEFIEPPYRCRYEPQAASAPAA